MLKAADPLYIGAEFSKDGGETFDAKKLIKSALMVEDETRSIKEKNGYKSSKGNLSKLYSEGVDLKKKKPNQPKQVQTREDLRIQRVQTNLLN